MDAFDQLPPPVRHWVAQAALPWSAASVHRVWAKSRAKGLTAEEALQRLSNAETKTLSRDRHSTAFILNSRT